MAQFSLRTKTAEDLKAERDAVIHDKIDAERTRRMANGTVISVPDYGDIPVQGRPQDQVNLLALKDTARDLIEAGHPEVKIPFRDGDNVEHMLLPSQMKYVADEGKRTGSAFYQAAWALKAMDPVPEDFTEDKYWPT